MNANPDLYVCIDCSSMVRHGAGHICASSKDENLPIWVDAYPRPNVPFSFDTYYVDIVMGRTV